MDTNKRTEILRKLGAADSGIDALLNYTANAFTKCAPDDDDFIKKWEPIIECMNKDGAAAAVNRHLARQDLQIEFASPETVEMELFNSISGMIPVISVRNPVDFENVIKNIIHKGKEIPNIAEMGASFAFSKLNRFIVLSNKPYANVPAEYMGLDETEWKAKSLIIRKHHECAHYFTKRFFSSSKNNLHDELIADFSGLYAAFGVYKAERFLKFMGIADDADGFSGRIQIYTRDLDKPAVKVIAKLAVIAAQKVEEWTKTTAFTEMDEAARIESLCAKDLLAYADNL
jgi:hypothetical protein